MPLITETYYLSLTQDNRGILRLRCSQDDTLRTVNLKLYNNGSIFVIPSGVSASISGVKQNGAVFSKPCTISQDRQSVVLSLSSDITNIDGIIVAEIVLNDGEGGRLGTSNFIIQVEKNPIRAGVVQDTETPIEYINDFIEKIQTLTARLNNLITPSGDASLAEVVDARIGILDSTTYQTLGARLNAEFQRLSNALNGVTILESTGDTTDRTSEILSKLNAYGVCKLGKGDFYVNGLVMPEDSMLVGSGKSTRVILPTSVTNGHVVKPRSGCIIENISFYGGFTGTYSELIASGSSAHRHCIILDRFDSISSENVILNNIFINNFVGSAIVQRYTVGCHCEDIIINMCYAGIDISNASYDGQFTNISLEDTRFGIVQNGSNFIFTNCVSKDSAYHIMSDQQNTGCTFSSCSFSESSLETTSKLASISNAREGFVFDNCLFDSSLSMLLNACDGIVIKGTNFVGSDTFAITVSNGRNTLLLITDCIADVEPTVTNAGTAARITSCYLKDGTAWAISEADITVDDELSDESENPVQNKVINREISEIKADLVNLEPGLSDAAKVALLECFRNVAWVDTNAYIHYGALEEALGIKKWDFEWNASSGVIPNGMTYGDGYTPEFSDDGLHILRADLPFYNYDDDCELEVCMKYDVEMSSANAMTPQLDMVKKTNGNLADGAKMWGLTDSGVNVIKENFSGQTVATNIEQDDFHVYNLKLENSTLTLSVDGSIVSSGQGISNNQYFPHTGIVSSGSPRAYTFFKSIKFRRIIKTQMSDSDELNINYGNLVTEYTTSIVSNAVNDQRAIAWYDRGISEILEYNGGSPRSFTVKRYPIPIPDNATKVTMEYVGNFLANLNLFEYSNSNKTYTSMNSIRTDTVRENGKSVIEINRRGNEVLFLVPLFIIGTPKVLPTNVRITFGFD